MATAGESPTGSGKRIRATDAAVSLLTLGHLALLVVFPSEPPLLTLFAIEVLAGFTLVGAQIVDGIPLRQAIGLLLPFLVLVSSIWGLQQIETSVFGITLLLSGSIVLVTYGLHRYELVALGLVEETT